MGEPLLQVTNPAHWTQVYDETFQAALVRPQTWYPMTSVIMPILLTSPFIALAASSADAQPHWRLGYWAKQFIAPSGFGLGAMEAGGYSVYLNRTTFAYFRPFAPQYQLRFEFPYWHKSMSVAVWEYSGPIDDTTEALIRQQIAAVQSDLARIETKIDAL